MPDQNSAQTEQPWKPAANPWWIAAGVMLATFMEVLDTSVANVSLPHIAGTLSVSSDESTWVLTSYLVSNAVILPASGWLGRKFGRRRFLITCITIFTIASVLCGMADSLSFLILARIVQGAGGGALQPVSQALWIGCLQVMPDKGQDADWFSSNFICWLAVLAALGFVIFLIRELTAPSPIVNLRVLKDRNLAIGVVLNLTVGAILYGTTTVLPLFLQSLLGYTSYEAGLVMTPRGIGAIIGSIVAGLIISKIDGRLWMVQGALTLSLSMFIVGAVSLNISPANVIWPIIITGFASTSIFVPMFTFAVATLNPENMGDAAGLTSLVRNLGGSVGISLVTTLVTRGTQAHQALLVGHLTKFDSPFRSQLATLQHSLTAQSGQAALMQAYGVLYRTLQQQAGLWAYVDNFRLLALICTALVPIIVLFKKGKASPSAAAVAH